jgi:uncharacterized protein YxeA
MVNKIKKNSASWRNPLLSALLSILVLASIGYGAYYWHTKNVDNKNSGVAPVNTVNYSKAPSADNNANNQRKGSSTPATTLDNGGSINSSSSSATFTVQIVSSNVNNGNVHIGNIVSGVTTGNCILTASQQGQNTLQLGSSSVHQDINNYDCGVFNIPTSSFTSSGNWQIKLTVTSGSSSASGTSVVTITG